MADAGPDRGRGRSPRRRSVPLVLLAGVAVTRVSSGTVAAHGTGSGGRYVVGLPWVLGVVVGAGLLAGTLAATGRPSLRRRPPPATVGRAAGAVLVVLGGVAALSALTRQPAVGLAGVAAGAAGGALVARYGGCGTCADATVGAVALHRLVEGVALAAAYAAGSAVGALGAVVIAGHTVAECAAVGGNPAFGRRRAVGAVLAVEAVFVGGVALGTVGAVGLPAVPRLAVLALVGGLLAVLGVEEVRSTEHATAGTRSVT